MKKKASQYKKLTGWTFRFMGSHKLFMEKDHLLLVNSLIFSESYKRLYFKDIQAIFLRKTKKYPIRITIISIVSLIFLLFTLYISNNASYFFMFMTVLGLSLLIRDLIKGPTCECLIKTAVQIIKISSINREKKAFQVISQIKPIITTEQKEIKSKQLALDAQPVISKNAPNISKIIHLKKLKRETGTVHLILFIILFIQGSIFVVSLFKHHPSMNVLLFLTFLSAFILSITGMAKQVGSNLIIYAKVDTVLVLIFAVVESIALYFSFIFQYMSDIVKNNSGPSRSLMMNPNFSMIQFMLDFSPQTNTVFFYTVLVFGILSLFFGVTGLIAIQRHRTVMGGSIYQGNQMKFNEKSIHAEHQS